MYNTILVINSGLSQSGRESLSSSKVDSCFASFKQKKNFVSPNLTNEHIVNNIVKANRKT